ncbi:MAG: hypothetical protein AB7R90_04280 [Reyranellaceae bacterium]
MIREAAVCSIAIGVLAMAGLAMSTPSWAQSSARGGTLAPPALENVPGSVVDTSLRDDEQAQRSVSDYIGQPLPDREAVVGRGQSLMYEMQRRGASPAAIERVRETTRRNACSGLIINADFDRDYLPPRTTLAFDLQPSNGVLARGFTPVAIGDQRVAAFGGVVRNPSQPIVGDALLGITQFFTPLANGRYRVVMFTDKLGEQAARLPFGRTITANNMPVLIADLPPPRWLVQGYLTNKAVAPGVASAAGGPGGSPVLSTNDLMTDQGGAIELEVDVATGALRLGFSPAAALSAIIIEPADQRSSLQLVGSARNGPALINDCFDHERRIGRDVARGSPFLGGPASGNPGGGGGPSGSPN